MRSILSVLSVALVMLFGTYAATGAERSPAEGDTTGGATTQPVSAATQPAAVPARKIAEIEKLFERVSARSQRERERLATARMEKVLRLGDEARQAHPGAPNLGEVRLLMLRAADTLVQIRKTRVAAKNMTDIATEVLASGAPAKDRVVADWLIVRQKVQPAGGGRRVRNPTKEIRALANRYEKTDAAAAAVTYAVILAAQTDRRALVEELADVLENKHMDAPGVRGILRQLGRHPDVGKPFAAELTTLAGKKLSLPEALRGKVVIIDFWATWCRPCVVELPHMKKVYAAFKDKGVEIVGISLDQDRKKLEKFVKDNKLGWVHTFTGKGWDDPTARKYGVGGIPSIWVVGPDGNVVSDNARADLEATIRKALTARAKEKGR